jgi:hypothetical protein
VKLVSIIVALLLLNIAMAACTRGPTAELCTAPETQEALQQLLRDEYSSFLANLGEDTRDTPAFDVPIASVVLVSVNAETGLVECSAGIGETAAEVRYAVTPNLTRPGHYAYRLTYMAPPAALEILRAAGGSERGERPAAGSEVEQPETADQVLSPEILALIERERSANGVCRGTPGGSEAACELRNTLGEQLYQRGMCYGREHEFGYQMEWHRCGPDSHGYPSVEGPHGTEQVSDPQPEPATSTTEDRVEYMGPPQIDRPASPQPEPLMSSAEDRVEYQGPPQIRRPASSLDRE